MASEESKDLAGLELDDLTEEQKRDRQLTIALKKSTRLDKQTNDVLQSVQTFLDNDGGLSRNLMIPSGTLTKRSESKQGANNAQVK